jgi:DNA (cytosine-5)-methyltransferase 1
MVKVGTDRFDFAAGSERNGLVRRLSVREAAEVQTFPADFHFEYTNIVNGYKMVGNAVPVRFAEHIARAIYEYLEEVPADLIPARGKLPVGRKPTLL